MPELPEMETYRQQLSRRILNETVTKVEVTRPKSLNISADTFAQKLVGNRIVRMERKAKHLLFHLATGDVLLLHLMLGGWMFYGSEKEKPDRTVQIELHFGEKRLYFIGLRLGYLHVHTPDEVIDLLHKLGPEPLGINLAQFRHALRMKKGTIKVTFVDQSFLSGIGNCYSDEICFEAGILPTRKVASLNEEDTMRLFQAMQALLREAIQAGGYMEEPLFVGDRLTGQYNDRCRVYDRNGEACLRCGNPIIQIELSSRKCFYCAHCQS
ncbi:Fpg/Nei family DNA glycosylase [Paenibacillus roseipurpureus]|uniref:Formamidopyrimidine-DNA glycosylase n=1 Tax=Paenibacillus roseopurpureus TaxID=2918901 RepID=A0AA96LNZ0_9BACL|nr:DNA-formamidopyrimidine glycosylase family protein [Paenibacillus sp. MBLB1832]WNR42265.1 DNA-formamidopyrimidine glycosylase family protein [Paenibacillus sp. MBLB1832]